MPRVYETMRKGVLRATATDDAEVRYTVRLWLSGYDLPYADHALGVAVDLADKAPSPEEAAEAIANKIVRLNAVEVVDKDGNGTVIYTDWP